MVEFGVSASVALFVVCVAALTALWLSLREGK